MTGRTSLYLFLLVILVASRFLLLCAGPGSFDSALYLLGVNQVAEEGLFSASHVFNHDTSFGLYLLGSFVSRAADNDPSSVLSALLVFNALSGVAAALLAGWIGFRQGSGSGLALLLVVLAAMMPRFWAMSVIVQPVVPATTLFLASRAVGADLPSTARRPDRPPDLPERRRWLAPH